MKQTITTQDSMTEPEDRVMSNQRCKVCQKSIRRPEEGGSQSEYELDTHPRCVKLAVSTHDELVKACESVVRSIDRNRGHSIDHGSSRISEGAVYRVRNVLAKAKVQP